MSIKPIDLSQMSAYDLIDLLDRTYQRPLPTPRLSHDQLMYEGGMRALVETLIVRKEREQNGNRHTEVALR